MFGTILITLVFLLAPVGVLWLCRNVPLFGKIGPVLVLNIIPMKILPRFVLALTLLLAAGCGPKPVLMNLRCEYQSSPINIDSPSPRFTWEYGAADAMQESFRIVVARDPGLSDLVWDSGEVASGVQRAVYGGETLESLGRYYWQLSTVAGGRRLLSPVQSFETSMQPGYVWKAEWISDGRDRDFSPAPMLRKGFELSGRVASARLYVSAAAYYRMQVNGRDLGPLALDPGFTDYSKTSLYSAYDVTEMLQEGRNVLSAVLGNGFFNDIEPVATWDFETAFWRERARMIAELHIGYEDGGTELIVTDGSWKASTGPYLSNNIYSGEIYDARRETDGWQDPGFDDSSWADAVVVGGVQARLVAQNAPPVQVCEVLPAVEMSNSGDTLYLFKFVKNISGVCKITLPDCPAGVKVKMRHGEMLKDDGSLQMGNISIYFKPLPDFEMQTDIYYTKGGGETYTPSFTYHGFQFVEVSLSEPVALTQESLQALFIHSDVEPAGSFECSDSLLNAVNAASKLSYLDNLISIPTDCPHREKNGWTGDANLAIDLGLLNYDGLGLYEKWVADMVDSQRSDGNLPGIVPTAGWGFDDWIGPVYASAFFMIPWTLMEYYGDTAAIERIYGTCGRYLDYLAGRLDPDGTVTYGIGDWVYYDTKTPTDFSTTAFYYWQNVLMVRFSEILGRDGSAYAEKAAFLKDLINRKHFDREKCIYGNGSQAGQAIALMFGLVPEGCRERVAANLNQSLVDNGYMLDFGSVGSRFVPRALAEYGYAGTVYKVMTQEEVPSWGAWMKMGLTTLAERWKLDFVRFRDSSANHVFLGDISAWMVRYLAGIRFCMDEQGGCSLSFKPFAPEGLDWARAEYKSVRGIVRSGWKRVPGGIRLDVELPANLCATVEYGGETRQVGGGRHSFTFKDRTR